MRYEVGSDQIECDETSVVTTGTFDGVHRGHQAILQYLKRRAVARNGSSTVVSFDPHPRAVVHGDAVPLLTTIDERARILDALGIDRFVVLPFTEAFANLQATEYVEEVLLEQVGMKEIVIGYDHAFGKDREGNRALLERMGTAHGFSVDVIPPQEVNHDVVSSSQIRSLLAKEGDVTRASELLGRPYVLSGTVEKGAGRGRQIGYPTANLDIHHPNKLVPQIGVYATHVQIGAEGPVHAGMMNIGRRPTFEGMDVTVEVHLLDFEGDLYGQTVRVEFLRRLRDEKKFDSVDDLVAQLSRDEDHCKRVIQALD